MDPHKVVIDKIKREHGDMAFDLLGKGICQARESADVGIFSKKKPGDE
jgi:hypothetical protein